MRKYDSDLGRFTSIDPLWEKYRSLSPYNYAENNPLVLKDPSGFGPGIGGAFDIQPHDIATGGMLGAPSGGGGVGLGQIIGAAVAAITGYIFAENTVGADKEPQAPPPATTAPGESKSEPILPAKPYVPEAPNDLPRGKGGHAVPSSDAPHTQLGERKSKSRPGETYPQSREWGEQGKKVKDIDWTDHHRPQNHPNPHQHQYDPKTGQRGDAEPLQPSYSVVGSSRPSAD